MTSPFTSQSVSSYNANPPADDGSAVNANIVKWSTIKTKLSDPLNTFAAAINSALVSAFGKTTGSAGLTSTGVNYTVQSSDQGKLIRATASAIVITTPDATSVGNPFAFSILNNSSASITCAGNGTQTVDGAATITIPTGAGLTIETDGSNWFTRGQNYISAQGIPQGRLTLTTATPILAADVTAATSVFYTPYVGNLVPVYNGTLVQMLAFSELTLTLQSNSNYAASAIFDIFIFSSSGTVTVGIGPAWTTATAGSGARGTGAGTTELQRLNGLWTNKVAMTTRNGSSTYTVAANQGTYVGSISMDASNGQVSCHVSYGQSRKFGIWNAYNRVPCTLLVGDTTASWNYTGGVRQSNAAAGNTCAVFAGLPEENVNISFGQNTTQSINSGFSVGNTVGVGINVTNAYSGIAGTCSVTDPGGGASSGANYISSNFVQVPFIGINNVNCLESSASSGGTPTFKGTAASMLLTAAYRA